MSAFSGSNGEVHFSLKYGDSVIDLSLPPADLAFVIEPQPSIGIDDTFAALRSAVENPINSPPLRAVIAASDKVVVIASDVTRLSVRCDILVPFVLGQLAEYGVPDDNITILFALGTHRRHTREEHVRVLGEKVVQRYRIVDHDCHDEAGHVFLGTTRRGTHVAINRLVVEADKIILTGGVDFHALAGFGGGRKALCPGVAYFETIQENHSLALERSGSQPIHPGCVPGRLKDNPVAEDLDEIAAIIEPHFILNSVVNPDARIVDVVAGHWRDAFLAGCERIGSLYSVPVPERFDAIIASCGGFPKDINMWQSVRGFHAAASALKDGGVVILVAEARDGSGNPEFEKWFEYPSAEAIKSELLRDFHLPGHVAMRLLHEVGEHPTFLVSSISDDLARRMRLRKVASVEEAIRQAKALLGAGARFAVMPYAKATIPVLAAD